MDIGQQFVIAYTMFCMVLATANFIISNKEH